MACQKMSEKYADKGQANGYKYEVIGGQHNLLACQKMSEKYADKDRQMATNMKSSVDSII